MMAINAPAEGGERAATTHLSQTRVFGCTESIPVVILTRSHEPVEQFRLFLVSPVLGALRANIGLEAFAFVAFSSLLCGVPTHDAIGLLALHRR
jgi:hypothetical protein